MSPTATVEFVLPPALATRHQDLLTALDGKESKELHLPGEGWVAEWPEGLKYADAKRPEAVAKILIGALHDHLQGWRIAYVWRESIDRNGQTVFAQVRKAGGQLHYFTDFDFVMEFNWSVWKHLTLTQQVALVDHELTHCGVEVTESGSKARLVPHDVEEFTDIITRWGLWRPSLEPFAAAVQKAAQLSLFPEANG